MATYEQTGDEPIEVYRSMSQAALAEMQADSEEGPAVTPFTIEVRFVGGLNQTQKDAFAAAADRWTKVIVGDLPKAKVDGETIDDLVILAQGANIDGRGKILGQAGPTHLRSSSAGAAAFLPAKGQMTFDTADLEAMEERGTLADVIAHEMGHVLGIGTVWSQKKLLRDAGSNNPTFRGPKAMKEYGILKGGGPEPVPVENTGGAGTRDSHWREILFRNELMSGFIAAAGNPLSRMTAASLADIGYKVDLNAADPYSFANLFEMAEEGVFGEEESLGMTVLPIFPIVLPSQSPD